jgi:glycosyltransferase involved in cell wall biosynthesis
VVVTGSTLGYQLLPYLRSVAPDVSFIDLSHVEEPHWLNGGHPRFGVGYQGALELNVTTTGALTHWMAARGADPQRMRVLYTGVRLADTAGESMQAVRRQVRDELAIAADVPVIVFAGRLCEQKRPALLARILKEARDAGLPFRAIVIGDGELRDELDDLLRQYQLAERVVTLRAIPHARWLQILTASDILLMPSQYEGISIALLEAMAAGVVPLVARVGGQEEVVSAEAGVLVPHSADELAAYVDHLRMLLGDSQRRQAMARASAHLAATRFSWPTMIDNFLAILDEADTLRRTQPRPRLPEQLGIELATQALELRRVNQALDGLWNARPAGVPEMGSASPEAQSLVRLAIVFSRTRIGRWIVRSRQLRRLGRGLARWMATPRPA